MRMPHAPLQIHTPLSKSTHITQPKRGRLCHDTRAHNTHRHAERPSSKAVCNRCTTLHASLCTPPTCHERPRIRRVRRHCHLRPCDHLRLRLLQLRRRHLKADDTRRNLGRRLPPPLPPHVPGYRLSLLRPPVLQVLPVRPAHHQPMGGLGASILARARRRDGHPLLEVR